MIKNITSFEMKKKLRNTNIMVLQGAKIKNIENLTLDLLREFTPDAICIHAGTNNINNESSIDEITGEMNDLIHVIKKK